jgi:probable LLM family oxidoreductase
MIRRAQRLNRVMVAPDTVQFGLNTFGGITSDATGAPESAAQVIRNLVEEAVAADAAGVDAFGIGEHHRRDFAVSSPETVLAAAATRTERILLGSAVTVLSTDDPVRVYERFATLDALSNGRAEVIAGRGSFTESFPLFGFDLADYDRLFDERLDLLMKLAAAGAADASGNADPLAPATVSWQGSTRTSLADAIAMPPTAEPLRVWVGVGGSPESVIRAARYNTGLFLAIIGGAAQRFSEYVELFRRAEVHFNVPRQPVAIHSPGFVGESDEAARNAIQAGWTAQRTRIGAERGWPPPASGDFVREVNEGALYVGSVETVARKIAATVSSMEVDRFDLKYDGGASSHEQLVDCIGRYGTQVIPLVRDMLSNS